VAACGWCKRDFSPGDRIELSTAMLPQGLGMLEGMVSKLVAPHLTRVVAYRCSHEQCHGLTTILYLPPAPPSPPGVSGALPPAGPGGKG
jgi:hypothetical protein